MTSIDSPEQQVRWLMDRAAIAECLVRYARCIDRRDWVGLQESYTEDGVMQHGEVSVPREAMPELSEKILAGCSASHHLVGDPSVSIDGDRASTHSHYIATHISEGTTVKRQGGGWYDCELIRTERGWKFTKVRSTTAWRTGEALHLH
ncbi:MAG TPA: nuclear transport factor 2 family protein [Candidatus Deferrimicrobium sp.]|nr:nuclear transport factor 2 family protein [Candidatus Deferrimicrobium sp.]